MGRTLALLVAVLLATAFLATASPATAFSSTARAADTWLRLDTPSFTFFSNAGDGVTRRYAAELETFRRFVARALGNGAVESPLPTHVYLFRGGFDEVSLGEGNVGWFTTSRQANVIAVDTSSAEGLEIAYHEYVHFVVENSTPAVPLWLNEGLAEFYSTFRVSDGNVEFGREVDRHVDYLRRHRLIPFADLFAVTRDSDDYTEERRRGVFYAQSWAFVHYLLVGRHEFDIEVDDFLRRLRDGVEAEEAYRAAFGTSTVGLRRDLEHYVSRPAFDFLRLDGRPPTPETLGWAAMLDDAEATARLGLLQTAGRVDLAAAADRFREALDLDPANATAMRGMGELALLAGDDRQAESWLAEAQRHRSGDPALYDLHGLALLQGAENLQVAEGDAQRAAERRRLAERARHSFARAIDLLPSFAPALSGYGRSFFWEDDPSEGIQVSARAVRLLPRNPYLLSTHLALVAQAGDVESARRVYAWLRRPAVRAEPQVLADADRALFNAEYQALVRTHTTPASYGALLEGLEELSRRAPDAELARDLDARLDELRTVVERNRWADTYNRALELLAAGERRSARRLLEDVADQQIDREIADEARRLLRSSAASGR